jgi:ATP-binding cassette, subfamily B, bacterial PglK
MKSFVKKSIELLGPDKKKIPIFVLIFLSAAVLDLAGIGLIGPYIAIIMDPTMSDVFFRSVEIFFDIENTHADWIVLSSLFLLCLFLIKTAASIWINYLIVRFSMSQQSRLRIELMNIYQNIPYSKYLYRNSSDYIYSIQTLTQHYAVDIVLSGMRTMSDGLVAIAILLLLAWINIEALVLLIVLIGFVVIVYDKLFRNKIQTLGELTNKTEGRIIQAINEGIDGIKEIRLLGCEDYFLNKVKNNSIAYHNHHTKSQSITTAPRYLLEFSMISFVSLFVLSNEIENFENFIPTLSAFGLAAVRLVPSANVLSNSFMKMRLRRNSVSKLYEDLRLLKQQAKDSNFDLYHHPIFSKLTLKDVSYRYPGSDCNSLSNINLEIKSGETIGIIGPSGSGKTTLLDILLGMLDPTNGIVEFNEKDLKLNKGDWKRSIAYLPQQAFLVDDSLKKNIALGVLDKDIDCKRIDSAIKLSKLTSLVKSMPNGLDTLIGERGVRLSGGQRQRIILARAFYYDRDILVMDESTSSLDNQVEEEISKDIQQLKGCKTIIIVSHRMSTLSFCNRIYKIDDGNMIAVGKPKDIIS